MVHLFSNPFSIDTPKLPVSKIIDRSAELSSLREALARRENVLLVGENGVGKTCLLRKLRAEFVTRYGPACLLVEMDVESLSGGADRFLPSVVLRLFDAAWTRVFKKPQSDLLESLSGEIAIEEHLKKRLHHFLQLFRLVRPAKTNLTALQSREGGASLIATTKIGESFAANREIGSLSGSEFLDLTTELLGILREDGVTQVIIFGDEANHIKPETETAIISQNLEAFSARDVQFVLTIKPELLQTVHAMKAAFPAVHEIEAFADWEPVRDLFEVYSLCDDCSEAHVKFDEAVIRQLWRIARGRPRQIQMLGQRIWQRVEAEQRNTVTLEDLLNTVTDVYLLAPRW
jgi:GTPase SAR1 family protein